MNEGMYIVRHAGTHYGPFRSHETASFAETLAGGSEILPLSVPRPPDEKPGPGTFQLMDDGAYRALVDSFKVDTRPVLAAITQEFYFARLHNRVLTVREMLESWDLLVKVAYAVHSLMHHAERVITNPNSETLEALRKAFWRNCDSADVDPHYADRFW